MTDPKQKQANLMREPKPKKKLGLVVPQPLQLPHKDLIKPSEEKEPALSLAPDATLASHATHAQRATVAPIDTHPLHDATLAQDATLVQYAINEYESTITPNDIWDEIYPTLHVHDQVVLGQLYRLTRGYHRDTCTIGIPRLAKRCNIGTRQVSISVERLEKRGLIKRLGADFSNRNRELRGNIYKMNLPEGKLARRATVAQHARDAQSATVAPHASMKHDLEKEISQTQRVSALSRYSLEECRRYAEHLKQTGQGITNPGGYATKIFRSGEADAFIEGFLSPPAQVDVNLCPDCRGTGFIYIDQTNHDLGVRPCRHVGLRNGA